MKYLPWFYNLSLSSSWNYTNTLKNRSFHLMKYRNRTSSRDSCLGVFSVHEEEMLAIGALAYLTGPDFARFMPEFYKYLELGLQNIEEYQVGDIFRALEENVLPWYDGITTQLLEDLSRNQLHRSMKPPIFPVLVILLWQLGRILRSI
uniref:Importin subunit beta-1/Transportin-1-like TPR repeats domain-containing protein n=1 Tax=Lactuca sativa TaxID=4236 RepID=A0A9R1X057_LACSA|nr:hypothetical protein LSAT_V11C800390610 [Lactuca sativa]